MSDADVMRIGPYLEANVDGFSGLLEASKFSDGQSNPTFLLKAKSGRYVLRKQPDGVLLKSAHAVDREYRVIRALQTTSVPVPRVYHLCEDREVLGSLFYVMSYVDGRIFWDPVLPELSNAERGAVYDHMNRALVQLHEVDLEASGLAEFGRSGDYFSRQVARWSKQYRASETTTCDAMEALMQWLPDNVPVDDMPGTLIHGDYRLDNMIFDRNNFAVKAILDWELSTLGHPIADLAYQCMQLRIDHDAVIGGLGGIERDKLGIPSEQEYVDAYCERRQLGPLPHWSFYLSFSFFRLAAILQGVLKRSIDGNASSAKAQTYGALAPVLANMGAEVAFN